MATKSNLLKKVPKKKKRVTMVEADEQYTGAEQEFVGEILTRDQIQHGFNYYGYHKGVKDAKAFIADYLIAENSITFICGRYEGIDQRVIDNYVDEEVSIGDFILSGGEYAAICLIDAISRHLPGTLGNKDSYLKDTFSNGLLKEDVYAKPEIFDSNKVPEILLSGNHEKIKAWKSEMSLLKTFKKRPDLLEKIKLTKKQKKLLEEWSSKAIL